MEEQLKTCYDQAFQGWEQKINDNGVIYYVNNEHQLTSWNHPYLDKVFQNIDFSFSDVKYAAYRTALKLRTLQMQLGLHRINIESLKETLSSIEDEAADLFLTYEQGHELIEKTLHLSQHGEINVGNIPCASDLIVNLIANLFDKSHSGKLVPRCVQNVLIALCGSKLCEKYKFLCARLPKLNGNIPREHLTCLIDDLMQIPYILKESIAFGIDVAAAVDSCLNNMGCNEVANVNADYVFSWLCCEPQTLVWLPTLHRMIATEKVQHAVRCNVCRVQPITGFRYRCLFCIGYNLCQSCFLRGRVSLSHKLTHQVKEYCFPVSSKDCTKAWLHILKNKLLRRPRGEATISYLAVEGGGKQEALLGWEPRSIQVDHICSFLDSGQGCLTPAGQTCDTAPSGHALQGHVNPAMSLGQPFDSSSPVITNETCFAKLDVETQNKMMILKIEELEQENRILRQRLHECQQKPVDKPDQSEEQYFKMAAVSSISPINNAFDFDEEEAVNKPTSGPPGHDTLAIVGAITPVRTNDAPAIMVEPSNPMSAEIRTNMDITESTRADGLQYRSSDMSLLSNDSTNDLSESKLSQDMGITADADGTYKPSDMSLLCAGLAKPAMKTLDGVVPNQNMRYISLEKEEVSVLNSHKLKNRLDFHSVCSESPRANPDSIFTSHLTADAHSALSSKTEPCSTLELSNIHPENFTITPEFLTHNVRGRFSLFHTPEHGVGESHRMTLEPRHQSTPVTTTVPTKRGKSAEHLSKAVNERSSHRLEKTKDSKEVTEDKENNSIQQQSSFNRTGLYHAKEKDCEKSGVLIDTSSNMQSTKRNGTHIKTTDSMRDSKAILTQDRDELDQIMADFERECKIADFTQSDGTTGAMTINDSSVMAAAFNIGDAMAEFVQAVAKFEPEGNVSHTSQMTHF